MNRYIFLTILILGFNLKIKAQINNQNILPTDEKLKTESQDSNTNTNLNQNPALTQISGLLLERGTKIPIKNSNLFLLPNKIKTTTNDRGEFTFEPASIEASSEIVVNFTGYKKLNYTLEFLYSNMNKNFNTNTDLNTNPDLTRLNKTDENKKVVITLYLEKESYQYLETTVTGLKTKKDSQKTLKAEEFLTLPGSGGDPVKAVQNLPGVNRTVGGDSRVVIQGGEPENTKYNIMGHDVPLIFHFGGLSSIVSPEAVQSVDYFSAGYGAELSRALGGHVGLDVKKPSADHYKGFAFFDIYNIGGMVEGPIDENSGFIFSGRYSYLGSTLKKVMKNNSDFNLTVAPTFYDLSFLYQTQLQNPTKDQFRVFTITSQDTLEFIVNKPISNDPATRGNFYQLTQFSRIIPEWSRQIDETSELKISGAFGNNDITADIGDNYFHLKNKSLSTRSQFSKSQTSLYKYSLGAQTNHEWYTVSLKFPNSFSEGGISNPIATGDLKETSISGNDTFVGLYMTNEFKTDTDSPWLYNPQLRYDYYSPTKEQLLQPRATIKYKVSEDYIWRVSSGLYYQPPAPQESDGYWGNPNIKSPQSHHSIIGFEKETLEGYFKGLTTNASLFYKDLKNDIISSSSKVIRNNREVTENYNNKGTGFIRGFETQFKFKGQSNTQWMLSYTYLQSRRKKPNEIELPSQYDQTHSLNLISSYVYENWLFGARFRYVTGNPRTPIVSSTFDSDNDVFVPIRGQIYSQRNSDFKQLDFRIDRKWIYDTWILSAYLDVQNLTNETNQESVTYSYDYKESKEITGLPTLPTIGVKGEF